MSEQEEKSFELDGTRPIEDGEIEVVDTFEEDGTRPIAKGRDFLVRDDLTEDANNSDRQSQKDNTNIRACHQLKKRAFFGLLTTCYVEK